MLKLLFFTAVRVSELCHIEVADVDLDACKIRINGGKGDKDRFVLFGKTFATALRTHVAAHPNNRRLFQTRRMRAMTRAKFPLGRVVATPGALEAMAESGQTPAFFLDQHASTFSFP